MTTRKEHWNEVYEDTPTDQLGWYEEAPQPSLQLISKCELGEAPHLLDAGAGATTLIDRLLQRGYENLTVVDISDLALSRLADRLGPEARRVDWVVGDLTDPEVLENVGPVDLWHDRAVLHFLTEKRDRRGYVRSLRLAVRPGGHVIIAAFSPEGADRCSGLDVRNYDRHMISELLGPEFTLERHFDYLYCQPSGDPRPYVYTLFRRTGSN